MKRKDFEEALYDSDRIITRNFSRFRVQKKIGGVAMINITKKALNASYAKLFVHDNLVECTPWESLNK